MQEAVSKHENFLGIDWGASSVGVSFAEAETRIAFALSTLKNDETLLDRIGTLLAAKEAGTVVVGVPSHPRHTGGSHDARHLGEALSKAFPVRVAFQDEMFTTKMAEANIKERGARHIARFDDTEAARIILQEWLDRRGDAAIQS